MLAISNGKMQWKFLLSIVENYIHKKLLSFIKNAVKSRTDAKSFI
jgi:hypothetical protein